MKIWAKTAYLIQKSDYSHKLGFYTKNNPCLLVGGGVVFVSLGIHENGEFDIFSGLVYTTETVGKGVINSPKLRGVDKFSRVAKIHKYWKEVRL